MIRVIKYLILSMLLATSLTFADFTNSVAKSAEGFIITPTSPRVCANPVIPSGTEQISTGFLYTGRIIWEDGTPYANGVVFISEGKTRAWEYVGKTNENGEFSLPLVPYTQFKLYAWDGTSTFFAKYDGHFYYNSELDNLYMTPTGGDPYIADKGDVVIENL